MTETMDDIAYGMLRSGEIGIIDSEIKFIMTPYAGLMRPGVAKMLDLAKWAHETPRDRVLIAPDELESYNLHRALGRWVAHG